MRNPSPHPDIAEILFSQDQIRKRISKLGRQISADYAGKHITLVGVLKGAMVFLSDMLRSITVPCSVDFMCLSSYKGDSSSGIVRLVVDLRHSPKGKDILIVEDIVDTGLTLRFMLDNLRARHARSIQICALLDKAECRKTKISIKYTGFTIPNRFVVGYGLDYKELYRNLPYVGIMKESKNPFLKRGGFQR